MDTVTMTHPDLPDTEIQVPQTAVAIHRASGWRTAEDLGENPEPATQPAATRRPEHSPASPTAPNGKE